MYICMYICGGAYECHNLWDWSLFFYYVGSGDQTHMVRFDSKQFIYWAISWAPYMYFKHTFLQIRNLELK